MTPIQRALDIVANYGVPVFPCREDKAPACANGFKDASKDLERIRELFEAAPDATLVGVPTGSVSGFDTLDLDLHKPVAEEWLQHNSHLIPPAARLQKTRRGGWHVFLKHHPGLRSSTDNPSKGLDVRADGGFIVWWGGEPDCALIRDGALDGCEWPADLLNPILAKHSYRGTSQPKDPEELAPPSAEKLIELLGSTPTPADCERDTYVALMLAVQGCIRGLAALGATSPEDLEQCAWAACEWATRWDHPHAPTLADARRKWDDDFSTRDNDLSGWRQLLGVAYRLGVDTAPYREPNEFDALPPEPVNLDVWDPWDCPMPPSFPVHILPSWLRDIVYDTHETIGCSVDATAMAYIAGIAGAVHGRTRVKAMRYGNWEESARLWMAFIGDPSTKKSPLLSTVMAPYKKAKAAAANTYRAALSFWEETPKNERGKKPPPPAIFTNDATPEALSEILTATDRGLMYYADELAGWLGNMERYTGKGTSRPFWLSAYNGEYFDQNRIGRGYVDVANLSVSIIGSVQMAKLSKIAREADLTDDGLLQRFLPVFLQRAKPPQDRPPKADHKLYSDYVAQLLELGPRVYRLDDDGHAIKAKAFDVYHDLASSEVLGMAFSAWVGKAQGFIMRLMVALHMTDREALGDETMTIPAPTVEKAVDLMEFCTNSAAALYYQIDENVSDHTRQIADWILLRPETEFTMRDFVRGPRCCRGGEQDVRRKISPLIAGGWLIPENGYPNCNKWKRAPGILEAFAERAKIAAQKREKLLGLIRDTAEARKAA